MKTKDFIIICTSCGVNFLVHKGQYKNLPAEMNHPAQIFLELINDRTDKKSTMLKYKLSNVIDGYYYGEEVKTMIDGYRHPVYKIVPTFDPEYDPMAEDAYEHYQCGIITEGEYDFTVEGELD